MEIPGLASYRWISGIVAIEPNYDAMAALRQGNESAHNIPMHPGLSNGNTLSISEHPELKQ